MTARAVHILVAASLGVGLFVIAYFAPRAWAAERTLPGAYDLNAYRPTSQMANPDIPNWIGPRNIERIETYDSRETCKIAAGGIRKVGDRHVGWKLRCDPAERVTR